MENQNIQWGNWEDQPQENNEQPQENNKQPQVNWGEQPQQENIPTWDERPQEEQSQNTQQVNWDEKESSNNGTEWVSDISESPIDISNYDFENTVTQENWQTKSSLIGLLPKVKIEALVYKLNYNNEQAINEIIGAGYERLDDDGRYQIKYKPNTELSEILGTIKNIGEARGMKLHHSFLYKNEPKESSINISRGDCRYNYIYFLQGDYDSGQVVIDFSSINGPSEQVIETTPGILLLLPGWVPYSISKNKSDKDMIAISGRFVAP